MNALLVLAGLGVGNFIFELLKVQPDFATAVEHTFFQVVAIGFYWVVDSIDRARQS